MQDSWEDIAPLAVDVSTPKPLPKRPTRKPKALTFEEAADLEEAMLANAGLDTSPVRSVNHYESLNTAGSGNRQSAPSRAVVFGKGEVVTAEAKPKTPTKRSGAAPALTPPTKPSMPAIKRIAAAKTAQMPAEIPENAEQFQPTQRDLLILTLLNDLTRLTCDQIAFYLVAQAKRPLTDVPGISESLRRTNLLKLQNNGSIKKISPKGKGTTPFFILTRLGAAHVDYPLPVDHELLSDSFDHDSLDRLEHKTISNLASVVIQIRTGTILLENDPGSETKVYSPPAQPVVTGLRIADAAAQVEKFKTADINKFQKNASKTWLALKPSDSGFTAASNGAWNMTDMGFAEAEAFTYRINQSINVDDVIQGKKITRKIPPAWLFNTYGAGGKTEIEPLAHFVILQPNIEVRNSRTGETDIHNGCIVGRVESGEVLTQKSYQYTLWHLFRSNHRPAKCLIISPTPAIKEAVQAAWLDLIDRKYVSKDYSDWIMFGDYEPLNSTRERLKQFTPPVPNKSARTHMQG